MSGLLWPAPTKYAVTQGFGRPALRIEPTLWLQVDPGGKERCCRVNKFVSSTQYPDVHPAVDIACPIGTPLVAVEAGKVVAAGVYSDTGEKYLMVRIHRDVTTQTVAFYTHLSKIVVPVGARVTRGQRVALSGNSGMSTGPHLHFEVRTGSALDDPARSYMASPVGRAWFRWNPERLRVGGDMAGVAWIKPN